MKDFKFYFNRIIPALIFIILLFLPVSAESVNLLDLGAPAPQVFSPFGVLIKIFSRAPNSAEFRLFPFCLTFYLLLLLPAISIYLIVQLFLKQAHDRLRHIVTLTALTLYLLCSIWCMITFANTRRWFFKLPYYIYITNLLVLLMHVHLTFSILFNHQNGKIEFETIQKTRKQEGQQQKRHFISIRTKVLVTILITILTLLGIFTAFILHDNHKMIVAAVGNTGRAQAEQAAAVYESAEGMNEKVQVFFEEQSHSNEFSNTPYDRIDIIITYNTKSYYIENIDSSTALPPYDVFAYTTGRPSRIPDEEKIISAEEALEYVKRYKSGLYLKEPVYDKIKGTCKYIHPVTFTRREGQKLVGFSIVTYRKEVLMKTYYQTKVFVLTLAVIFLYIVILITFILTDYITTPLIYLKSNVQDASSKFSQIIASGGQVGAEALVFNDDIKTKDEIKDLSTAINDFISLIRGLIPYISNSTLKYADREPDSQLSVAKDLCFLFTDIRGFTSMCEGRPAREVVRILNHYLELETEIIIRNHGEIDKYVGDEVMAFFAGARKEYNACKAAMEIRKAMRKAQELSLQDGSDYVSMGIGISTGRVIFGSVGSSKRKDFTSIGDTVNIAARLESANKAYGSKAIITEAVFEKLQGSFICRELDLLTVKGKSEPIRIYEILQQKEGAENKIFEIRDFFQKGLNYYRRQNWDKAEAAFKECVERYNDMPSVIFLDRIRHFRKNPPPEKWDGVFELKVK